MKSDQALSKEQLEQMKRLYGFDKPHWEAYLIWLGVLPRETEFRQIRFTRNEKELAERVRLPKFHLAELDWNGDGYLQRSEVPKHLSNYLPFDSFDSNGDGEIDGRKELARCVDRGSSGKDHSPEARVRPFALQILKVCWAIGRCG